MRNTLRPTSIPVSRSVGGNGWVGTSAHEKQTYQPSASLESVTVLMRPSTARDHRTARRPILERTREPFSRRAPVPYSLLGEEGQRRRPRERGDPGFPPALPALVRGKKGRCALWTRGQRSH